MVAARWDMSSLSNPATNTDAMPVATLSAVWLSSHTPALTPLERTASRKRNAPTCAEEQACCGSKHSQFLDVHTTPNTQHMARRT